MKVSNYQHTNVNDEVTVNTGIAYMNNLARTIVDNRTNKSIEYAGNSVSISGYTGYVYSIVENTGNPDAEVSDSQFENSAAAPKVIYKQEQNDSIKFETTFDTTTNRWINTLTLDLDVIGSYNFSFNDLAVHKNGVDLNYKVKNADKNDIITLNQLYNAEYTLVVTDDQIYNANGELTGSSVEKELVFIIHATKTSIEPPEFAGLGTGTAIKTHEKSGTSDNWRPAYRALENVFVTYWSASQGKTVTIDLSTLNTKGTINSNVWTYTCDDYTLTITGGQVHTDGSKISPKVVSNVLFFWSADKAFGTGTTSRDINLTYTFTDTNASTTENLKTSVSFNSLTYYKKSDFAKGTLTEGKESSCVTPDTLITLADGTQKRIDAVTYSDQLLVWNFFEGKYDTVPSAIIFNHGNDLYEIVTLEFEDGTTVKTINGHGFFDIALNDFVFIDKSNVEDYIGHKFVKENGNKTTAVKLVDYTVTEEYTGCYSIQSAMHINFITEGMFSQTVPPFDGWFDYFEIGKGMKYDEAKMQADIETYGLYTYEEFADYVTYEQFIAFNGPYLKVLVGRGVVTFEQILDLIATYVN